jgi:hypothetical protein
MSSKRRLRRRSCEGKTPYATSRDAAFAAQRNKRPGEETSIYKCRWGHHWHWGHTPKRNLDGMRRIGVLA